MLVMKMKLYMKILLGASIVGGILAFFFYLDINKEVQAIGKKDDIIYLFQAGVFKIEENAYNFASNFEVSLVYKDEEYYRVIIGVAYGDDVKNKLEDFFDSLGIQYFLKKLKVENELIATIKSYEEVLIKTTKTEVIYSINDNMLKAIDAYLK